jgi:hypothetical protein
MLVGLVKVTHFDLSGAVFIKSLLPLLDFCRFVSCWGHSHLAVNVS